MSRAQQLNELIRQTDLSVDELATLLDVSPSEVRRWIDDATPAPDSLFTFLRSYLELKSISQGVSCPLPR